MVADRNLWRTRANQAWGTNQTWGVAPSYQTDLTAMTTDRNTWQTRAGQAYDTGTWGSGTLWSTHYTNTNASLTAMTNDRNYWQHTVAHNDTNVWNTRYSTGYTDGANSKGTSSNAMPLSATGGLPGWPSTTGDLGGGLYCQRAGLAHASARMVSTGDDAALHIYKNNVLAIQGESANGGQNTSFAVHGTFSCAQGDYISVRASGSGDSGLQGGQLILTVGSY